MPVPSASLLDLTENSDLSEIHTKINGVNKGMAEPYADTIIQVALPVDMAAD